MSKQKFVALYLRYRTPEGKQTAQERDAILRERKIIRSSLPSFRERRGAGVPQNRGPKRFGSCSTNRRS
jgi:hypothetical protein